MYSYKGKKLDTYMEIIGGTTNALLMLDLKSVGTIDNYWTMYKGNNYRTSFYQSDCIYGDLDYNQSLDVLDIIILVNIILGYTNEDNYLACQIDSNEDGIVNIVDLVFLISDILDE